MFSGFGWPSCPETGKAEGTAERVTNPASNVEESLQSFYKGRLKGYLALEIVGHNILIESLSSPAQVFRDIVPVFCLLETGRGNGNSAPSSQMGRAVFLIMDLPTNEPANYGSATDEQNARAQDGYRGATGIGKHRDRSRACRSRSRGRHVADFRSRTHRLARCSSGYRAAGCGSAGCRCIGMTACGTRGFCSNRPATLGRRRRRRILRAARRCRRRSYRPHELVRGTARRTAPTAGRHQGMGATVLVTGVASRSRPHKLVRRIDRHAARLCQSSAG